MAELIFVQFSDASQTAIVSYFGSPQDPAAYQNQGSIEPTDARWKTFYDALPLSMRDGLPVPA